MDAKWVFTLTGPSFRTRIRAYERDFTVVDQTLWKPIVLFKTFANRTHSRAIHVTLAVKWNLIRNINDKI